MGVFTRDAFKIVFLQYIGILIGFFNKGYLFILIFSTEKIGLLNLLFTIASFLSLASNMGTSFSVSKFYPYVKSNVKKERQFTALNFKLILFGILLFVFLLIVLKPFFTSFYIEKSKLFVEYYYLLIPLFISLAFNNYFENILKANYYNVLPIFVIEVLSRLYVTIGIIFYYFSVISFEVFVYYFSFNFVFIALILFLYSKNKGINLISWTKEKLSKSIQRIIIRFIFWNYLNSFVAFAVITIDSIMVTAYLGLDFNGIYSTMIFISSALLIPYKSMTRIGQTTISEKWKKKDIKGIQDVLIKTSTVGFSIYLILAGNVILLEKEITMILPEYFEKGFIVLKIILLARLVDVYFGLNGIVFIYSKLYKYDLLFSIILLLGLSFLNTILIPYYGMVGAAISTLILLVLYNFLRSILLYANFKLNPFQKKHLVTFTFALVFIYLIKNIELSNIVVSIIVKSFSFSTLFLAVLYLFKLDLMLIDYIKGLFKKFSNKII